MANSNNMADVLMEHYKYIDFSYYVEKYNVNFYKINDWEVDDYVVDLCTCDISERKIGIGVYDDTDKLLVSIYHEIGHIYNIEKDLSNVEYEKKCWKIGLKLLHEDFKDFKIPYGIYRWIIVQYSSYTKRDV